MEGRVTKEEYYSMPGHSLHVKVSFSLCQIFHKNARPVQWNVNKSKLVDMNSTPWFWGTFVAAFCLIILHIYGMKGWTESKYIRNRIFSFLINRIGIRTIRIRFLITLIGIWIIPVIPKRNRIHRVNIPHKPNISNGQNHHRAYGAL